MCGRYFIDDQSEVMIHYLNELKQTYPALDLSAMATKEIFPAQTCLTLTGENLEPQLMKWGYPKWDGKGVIINARSEDIQTKSMFRDDIRKQRCLIVSSGFFEWDADKKRHTIRGDEPILYMAGVYRYENEQPVFAILTKASTGSMKEIHDRSPLMLRQKNIMLWQGKDYQQLLAYSS